MIDIKALTFLKAVFFFSVVFCAEDFETSLSDYKKALSILEQLVEPDSRKIADLYPCRFHDILV